jgi:predicted nucleic acid-binding protein
MKALIDTNVVLDALMSREPWRDGAERILLAAAEGRFQGYLSASAVTDVFYLLRKHLGSGGEVRDAIGRLFQVVRVLDVTEADCLAALDSAVEDYEDAVQAAAAARAGFDWVVTRDQSGFAGGGIRSAAPEEFLASLPDAAPPAR